MGAAAAPRAIATPAIDLLSAGAISLLVCLPFIVLGRGAGHPGNLALLSLLINLPHFLASYRILYRSREMVLRYPVASLLVPGALLVYGAWALSLADEERVFVDALMMVAGGYLAWHYTGQTWGMIAAYGALGGTPPDARERLVMRAGLRVLLFWHVCWYCHLGEGLPELARSTLGRAYPFASGLALLGAVASAGAVLRLRRRHGRVDLRLLLAWLSIHAWYLAMARNPAAVFCVQLLHAAQYLTFPLRVEANRAARQGAPAGRRGVGLGLYFLGLVLVGFTVMELLTPALRGPITGLWGPGAVDALPAFLLGFLNIHHYVIDGYVWKLRDPQVRADLFGHLPLLAGSSPAPQQPPTLTRARARLRSGFKLGMVTCATLAALLAAELALRARGYRPYQPLAGFEQEPARLEPDPARGWRNRPGRWTHAPYVPGGRPIEVGIDPDGARRAEPARPDPDGRPELLLLGCSFAHGHGLSDHETVAWALQARYPGLAVRDHGTNGYGTVQSILLLRELAGGWRQPPAAVVYVFGDFHQLRNVADPLWLLGLQARGRLGYGAAPFCTLDARHALRWHAPASYPTWPLRARSALVLQLESAWATARCRTRAARAEEVTCALLVALDQECRRLGTRLLVAMITRGGSASAAYGQFMSQLGIAWVDAAHPRARDPDTRVPGEGIHPAAAVHAWWSERIAAGLAGLGASPERE